jgi:hypothetical protein
MELLASNEQLSQVQLALKFATGAGVPLVPGTENVKALVWDNPPASRTVRVQVRVFAPEKVMLQTGCVEMTDGPPGYHSYAVIPASSVDPVPTKVQVIPEQFATGLETGGWLPEGGAGMNPEYNKRLGDPVPGLVTTPVVAALRIAVAT